MPIREHHLGAVGSTMEEARRLWRESGSEGPLLVVATEQRLGVGRSGREWASPLGGLWMTLALECEAPVSELPAAPLMAGLAVAVAVKMEADLQVEIKWPNDVLLEGRKLAGILCQHDPACGPRFLLVGIGLNANFPSSQLAMPLHRPAISLLDVTGTPCNVGRLASRIGELVVHFLQRLAQNGASPLLAEVDRRLAWRGTNIRCALPDGTLIGEGEILGVASDGSLRLRAADGGVLAVRSGELARVEVTGAEVAGS